MPKVDVTLSMAIAGNTHIVYTQVRYRNNAQAIYILRKQYTYWVHSMAIAAICNMVAAIRLPPHSSSRPWCHQSSFGSLSCCFLFSDVIIVAKPPQNLLAHAKGIWCKTAQQPKRRLMASRPTWRMSTVEGWQQLRSEQPYCILLLVITAIAMAYCALNMCIACAVCILLAHCSHT